MEERPNPYMTYVPLVLLGLLLCFVVVRPNSAAAPPIAGDARIRFDTVGYLPERDKRASIAVPCDQFVVRESGTGKEIFTGKSAGPVTNTDTNEELYIVDFTSVRDTGDYYLDIPGVGRSAPFRIAPDVYNDALQKTVRAMYLWRCGVAVSGEQDGAIFSHPICHTDDAYLDFVGGEKGAKKDAAGGWHDAGDYNKYVVNAGVSVGVMFLAWEQFAPRVKKLTLNLPPERGKTRIMPDYLRELKFEMDWLLKMQAGDGSVYHKVSTQDFGPFVLPDKETAPRYFAPWSSAATADFAAMTAQAARIYAPYDSAFAKKCRDAAEKSYRFLREHPENHRADLSAFRTGAYQSDDADDRLWAAAELWETTGDAQYLADFQNRARAAKPKIEAVWDWGNVGNLGMIAYMRSRRQGRDAGLVQEIKDALIATADSIVRERDAHGYARPLGTRYYWGANGAVARQTVILQTANALQPKKVYEEAALDAMHHLLGRNVYGRSFVTGIGAEPPLHPHDRRSGGDAVDAPWPGYLVGGGWPKATDWKDTQDSYQTNEIAINWNAALIYALAGFASQ